MDLAFPGQEPITVIGDGLAGTVLALSLARRGAQVRLIGDARHTATALSYGAVAWGPPSWAWRRLERLHGPLGWYRSGLVFHDARPGLPGRLAALTRRVPVPLTRIDTPTWMAARLRTLAAAGVHHLARRVRTLRPLPEGAWALDLDGPGDTAFAAPTVVLAAGAGSRHLWPALPARFRHTWAGVLQVGPDGPPNPWLEQARRGRIVQPRHWQRPALEAGSAAAGPTPRWIVDAGLAPWGDGVVVGQISWLPEAGVVGEKENPSASEPPDPQWMEQRLREGLARLDPQLAALHAPYQQVPVSFCTDGRPLMGPVEGAPGLWTFTGFSAAFSLVPAQADQLATRLLRAAGAPGQGSPP
ncbi:MAG: FAD-dependent oxidoreductase [Cyanobacteriota bacterium]|nr:FAD-dependent oxidoreductase [Cyanobacteriota bacterium]